MSERENSTRAEMTRQRRTHRTSAKTPKRARNAPQPYGKSAHGHPVMMRGMPMEMPVRPRKKENSRRRYDIALGASGAEVQLPSLPILQPNLRWLSGLLALGLAVLLYYAWNAPMFQVAGASFEGLDRLEERDLNQVMGLGAIPVFLLNPLRLENDLRVAFPELLDVSVAVGWPNKVDVVLEERVPILIWQHPQGVVLVDGSGVSFISRADAGSLLVVEAPRMIIAPVDETGNPLVANPYVGRQLLSEGQVSALVALSQAAPAGAVMLFDPDHGMGWRDPGGWDVYFGVDGSDIGAKMQVYIALVGEVAAEEISPKMISVEHLHAPYYRMER